MAVQLLEWRKGEENRKSSLDNGFVVQAVRRCVLSTGVDI